jgi:hypothetical protein
VSGGELLRVGVASPLADVDTICGACHSGNATALADPCLRQVARSLLWLM